MSNQVWENEEALLMIYFKSAFFMPVRTTMLLNKPDFGYFINFTNPTLALNIPPLDCDYFYA